MTVITPTVGRVVWYYPGGAIGPMTRLSNQPFKADVVYVWNDRCVNLIVTDHKGNTHRRMNVALLQEGETVREGMSYCAWMPYQIGQAKKHEAPSGAENTKVDPTKLAREESLYLRRWCVEQAHQAAVDNCAAARQDTRAYAESLYDWVIGTGA